MVLKSGLWLPLEEWQSLERGMGASQDKAHTPFPDLGAEYMCVFTL